MAKRDYIKHEPRVRLCWPHSRSSPRLSLNYGSTLDDVRRAITETEPLYYYVTQPNLWLPVA